MNDLAVLFGVTEGTVRVWVNGKKRLSEKRKTVLPILDPKDLRAIFELLISRQAREEPETLIEVAES